MRRHSGYINAGPLSRYCRVTVFRAAAVWLSEWKKVGRPPAAQAGFAVDPPGRESPADLITRRLPGSRKTDECSLIAIVL
jgi:hypothetical protein